MKRTKLTAIVLVAAAMIFAACSRKPAYSDIEPKQTSKAQNQNESQAGSAPAPAEGSAPQPAQPPPSPPQPPKFKTPSFIDQASGDIKDLPNYPRSQRIKAQLGPVQGVNMASFVFVTQDPMEKIVSFYEKALKSNGWTLIDKKIDAEASEFTLKKGEDGAKVEIKKDPQSGVLNIMLVRGEKLE